MQLWLEWWKLVKDLRPACSRARSFLWLVIALAGFCTRSDLAGVTSIVRILGLKEFYYDRLLDFFHSSAVNPDILAKVWTALVLKCFPVFKFKGRLVKVADGIKVPKAGKKMPGVKSLHQESESNTKPEYIMGHSCQAVSIVIAAGKSFFAVPLSTRIHEGLIFSNRCKKKLTDKLVSLIQKLETKVPFYLVVDAYYACQKVALPLLGDGDHIVTRVRNNVVAYYEVKVPLKKKPGRPKRYGDKIKLQHLFKKKKNKMSEGDSPVYGEKNVQLRYYSIDLLWKPLGRIVRFVLVDHPSRGKCILMSTDLSLEPLEIIQLYGIRFKIEVSFKSALRVLGTYSYHFWMRNMKPIQRNSGDQYLHHETEKYRKGIKRKMEAYHRYIQVGIIAQGLLQYLSSQFPDLVWKNFGSWLRTIRNGIPPSELITANALRTSLPEFLASSKENSPFAKFLLEKIDLDRAEGFRLAG